jgi:Trypsin-like peptidase domain
MLLPVLVAALAATPAQPETEPADLRLVRSVSGTRGKAIGNRYEVEDPRTVFSPEDRQLVVYFEWDGAPGRYQFEGRWKDPSGNVVLTSPADSQARGRRIGVYWTLGLPANAVPGLWALEAHAGGRVVGTHAFEIRGGLAEPAALAPAVLFEKGRHGVALLEQVGASGERKARGLVTALDADRLIGPFAVVDGASILRVVLPDGRTREVQEVGAWNRKEGWAVLRLPGHGLTVLPPATAPAAVGSRVFVIGAQEDGGRTIQEELVNGEIALRAGRRAPRLGNPAHAGSAVLTGRGELLGVVVSGQVKLGSVPLWTLDQAIPPENGTTIFPQGLLPAAAGESVATLEQLAGAGAFMKPLSPDRRHITSGVFAGSVQRGGVVPMPTDQRDTYSRREKSVSVFIQWTPQDKRDAMGTFEVYDPDNRRIVHSEPIKLKLRRQELFFSTWAFALSGLAPEVYRVDLALDGAPVWRGWVRITD